MNQIDTIIRESTQTRVYHPLHKFNYDHAYQYYVRSREFVRSFDSEFYGEESIKLFAKCERQLEIQAEEIGISETKTGLISENALVTRLQQNLWGTKHRTEKGNALATEHPITKRCIAKFLLWDQTLYSFDEYWAIWNNHLITTVTTNDENRKILQPLQQQFKFGDCWKLLYERAGIKLLENPNLRNPGIKAKWIEWLNERGEG